MNDGLSVKLLNMLLGTGGGRFQRLGLGWAEEESFHQLYKVMTVNLPDPSDLRHGS